MTQIDSDGFWEMYWETRLQALQNLGKREAILATSRLMRQRAQTSDHPLRLLELGCGEAQIIGPLVDAHAALCDARGCTGIDYLASSIQTCRRAYPAMTFIEGDFTDAALLESLGAFDIVIAVNALHEVFSAGYSSALGEIDVPAAKHAVERALGLAAARLAPGGHLVLFDGLEPPGDPRQMVRLQFLHPQAYQWFEQFAREYHPFHITYHTVGRYIIELPRRDFTRYIDKSIFLGKSLWKTERLESYQYFTEAEFRAAFARAGLEIHALRTLTVDDEKWRRSVEILTTGVEFPEEHIMIVASKGESE